MPTPTYTPLANITLGSSAASVTFSSISQAYKDLILVVSGTSTSNSGVVLRANSDSGSNYSWVRMFGSSSGATSASGTETYFYAGNFDTSLLTILKFDIMDYSATDKHKSALVVRDVGGDATMRMAERWASTSAITSLAFTLVSGSYASGTSFALFGVAA